MRRAAFGEAAVIALSIALPLAGAPPARAQSAVGSRGAREVPAAGPQGAAGDLRARFGPDMALRLVQSTDPDERVRGLERAAALHTPEALALLERAARARVPGSSDPHVPVEGVARRDPRALLWTVRGLADWLDREPARAALLSIVDAPTQSFDTRASSQPSDDPSADDADGAARIWLARQEAAIALAETGNPLSLEALVSIGRSAGAGQGPALDALAIHPPASPLLGGVVLTTPATVALAAAVGDLRSLDAIESTLHASDAALRAAALRTLGTAGDARAAEAARGMQHDRDPRVRIAAAEALVRLGTADAPAAVEALVGDDTTAIGGLRLARLVQSEGVTRAAAARAAVSASDEVRAAALAALERQTHASAVSALLVLARDPTIQGQAAAAIARSPSPAAPAAIERLAATADLRRLAARASLVRRLVRGEAGSPSMDALLESLAGARDPRDRAVGVEALVALGRRTVAGALADRDAGVRRAAALGALWRRDAASRSALLARLAVEPDPTTQEMLALGLVDGDPLEAVPTVDLARRARGGGTDAPLAALALARRSPPDQAETVEALLASRDPVLRAHAARGLGMSRAPDAVGRLDRAYTTEGDVNVRRAIVAALADLADRDRARGEGSGLPPWARSLELAARLEPDRVARWAASQALLGAPRDTGFPDREVAWIQAVPATGATIPPAMTGALLTSEGLALPIAFDDDGYAVVPGVPPGDAVLRLAPRASAYDAAEP